MRKTSNAFGIAAICIGTAALVTAIGTAVVNVLTLKWAVRIYEPFDRLIRRSEPLCNKFIDYGEQEANKYFENQNQRKKYDEDDED